MPTIENHKEMVPFEHYTALYAKLDPAEVREVPAAEGVPSDITGALRTGETALPGPFLRWE